MKKIWTLRGAWFSLALLLSVLWTLPAFAQAGKVLIDDPDKLLGDGQAVRDAANRLAAEGVDVVVVVKRDAGTGTNAALNNLGNRVRLLGVADGLDKPRGNAIIFALSPSARFSGIYLGPGVRGKITTQQRDRIRTEQMQSRFSREDYVGGMVAAIDGVRTAINPPTSPLVYALGGLAVVGLGAAVLMPVLRRRKAVADTLATARGRMEEARRAAGVALADVGQHVSTARDKAQFDRVSYSAADIARLAELQSTGENRFTEAQGIFDAAEEARSAATNPSANDYESLAAKYTQAQQLALEASGPVQEAERIRATLDQAGAPTTGATTRL
jgi:hypothetical protein